MRVPAKKEKKRNKSTVSEYFLMEFPYYFLFDFTKNFIRTQNLIKYEFDFILKVF
jgi:hypothetical protein